VELSAHKLCLKGASVQYACARPHAYDCVCVDSNAFLAVFGAEEKSADR